MSLAFKLLPIDYPKRIRPCKFCGNYIYITFAELGDGRKRHLPINDGTNSFHDCPLRPGVRK